MPSYLSPGVYVEEVPSAVKPIAGAGTSTAAFVGVVPADVAAAAGAAPVLCTSFADFTRRFGDFPSDVHQRTLAHAVYGFFNNGGTRCWIRRVPSLGVADVRAALASFEPIDEIALVAVPGAPPDAQEEVLGHCEKMLDRFAILDGQPVADAASLTPGAVKGTLRASDAAALYYPYIRVADPKSGTEIDVPPSGHLAGVYARVDAQRGVHKAPANEVIRGALGVSRRLGTEDQAGLNPSGVNVLRVFDGSVTVWGARTLSDQAEWQYVNVRRLLLFLRTSIERGTRWVVFEPNTPALWARINRNVTAFLTGVWRDGALFGSTPQEAFSVRCDASTNPPAERDQGHVVIEIGVAMTRPAEFVVFHLTQWAGPAR